MTTDAPRSDSPPEPYYGFRFPETDGDVTMMDRVSPYPPEFVASFFKTERCLIARAFQPPKVYQPCTDMLPRTMSWLAAGVPMDFIDRVDSRLVGAEELPVFLTAVEGDAAIERAGISGFDMAQVPDPCCCQIHAGAGNRCPDCPQHSAG